MIVDSKTNAPAPWTVTPSNHPDSAEWLMQIGIDPISLSPDSLPAVAKQFASKDEQVITTSSQETVARM